MCGREARGWNRKTNEFPDMLMITMRAGSVAAYCASKGAVVLLTKSVAVGYAKYKIHCNAICPGRKDTRCFSLLSDSILSYVPRAA